MKSAEAREIDPTKQKWAILAGNNGIRAQDEKGKRLSDKKIGISSRNNWLKGE